jgi:uncharacterized membrane protein
MRAKYLDLLGAALIALLTLVVALFNSWSGASQVPAWFLPFGILMVLFIPGYALTLAILPHLDRAAVLLLSLGISISMVILGGLILNYTSQGLRPFSLAVWLGSFSLLACMVAARRRSVAPSMPAMAAAGRAVVYDWNWKAVAGFLGAAALIIAAMSIAQASATRAGTTFTQLWAVPRAGESGYVADIGIGNKETRVMHYTLFAEYRGATMNQWTDITLAPGETWTVSMPVVERPREAIVFLLYRTDAPGEPYRSVQLAPESFDELDSAPGGE